MVSIFGKSYLSTLSKEEKMLQIQLFPILDVPEKLIMDKYVNDRVENEAKFVANS